MTVDVIFETRDSFWENLIQKFQGFSHVYFVMEGMRYETHPRHGVIVSKYTEGDHPELKTKIQHNISYTTAAHIKRTVEKYKGRDYGRMSMLQTLFYDWTGLWVGGIPEKPRCDLFVALCFWPESEWWKESIKSIYKKINNN